MSIVRPEQNPQRYSRTTGGYKISAEDLPTTGRYLAPLVMRFEDRDVTLEPLLSGSMAGVVVYLPDLDRYLCSPALYQDLLDSKPFNPHFSVRRVTSVNGSVMGRTVPVISVQLGTVRSSMEEQGEKVKNAGVRSVAWPLDENGGIDTLIAQLNWTLNSDPNAVHPSDRYSVWDLSGQGDYSISTQFSASVDINRTPGSIEAVIAETDARTDSLKLDVNVVKDAFYQRVTPTGRTFFGYDRVANVNNDEDMFTSDVRRDTEAVAVSDGTVTVITGTGKRRGRTLGVDGRMAVE